MRIVSNEEMRLLDKTAIEEVGIPSVVLMENAGLEAGRIISEYCKEKKYEGEILIFCGKGKNGGDGLVVARRLISNGHRVRVFLLHPESVFTDASKIQLEVLKKLKAKVSMVESASTVTQYFKSATPPFLVVDAILGTGLQRDIEGIYFETVEIGRAHV